MLKRNLFLWLFTVAITFGASAQNYEWKEAQGGGYTYKYVTHDPTNARFYTLKNGLTVILSPTNKEPRIQCYVAVKAGSKTDPATNTKSTPSTKSTITPKTLLNAKLSIN